MLELQRKQVLQGQKVEETEEQIQIYQEEIVKADQQDQKSTTEIIQESMIQGLPEEVVAVAETQEAQEVVMTIVLQGVVGIAAAAAGQVMIQDLHPEAAAVRAHHQEVHHQGGHPVVEAEVRREAADKIDNTIFK